MRRLQQLPLRLRGQVQLFFQPVQRHFALSNLLGELRVERRLVVRAFGASCRENLGQLLLETVLPGCNLRRMHPVGAGEVVDGFQPFERFQCHTGFALGTLLFSLCRHRPSPPLLWTQHSILMTCPVFGVHYSKVHDYPNVSLQVVWETIQNDLPLLLEPLRHLLEEAEE